MYLSADEQGLVLEERPDTVYSRVATSPDGKRVAYSRSPWAYAQPFEIDPVTGGFTHLPALDGVLSSGQATPAATAPDGRIAALNDSFGFGGHNVVLAFRSV